MRLSQRYPPILRAMGFLGVSTWPIGCDTPSPFFWAFPPWRAWEVEVRYPLSPSKGVSQRYLRDTIWKQGKWVRYPPLRYYLERVLRDMGGVSRTGPLRFQVEALTSSLVTTEGNTCTHKHRHPPAKSHPLRRKVRFRNDSSELLLQIVPWSPFRKPEAGRKSLSPWFVEIAFAWVVALGTNMKADPDKYFLEWISEILLMFFAG